MTRSNSNPAFAQRAGQTSAGEAGRSGVWPSRTSPICRAARESLRHRELACGGRSLRVADHLAKVGAARPIESIHVGDIVWAWDDVGRQRVRREVRQLFRHSNRPIVAVRIACSNGVEQVIEATTDHPFWVGGQGWTAASKLLANDRLQCLDPAVRMHVQSVAPTGGTTDVYNFEVEGVHNYFVGQHGTLVHNESTLPGHRPGLVDGLTDWTRDNFTAPVRVGALAFGMNLIGLLNTGEILKAGSNGVIEKTVAHLDAGRKATNLALQNAQHRMGAGAGAGDGPVRSPYSPESVYRMRPTVTSSSSTSTGGVQVDAARSHVPSFQPSLFDQLADWTRDNFTAPARVGALAFGMNLIGLLNSGEILKAGSRGVIEKTIAHLDAGRRATNLAQQNARHGMAAGAGPDNGNGSGQALPLHASPTTPYRAQVDAPPPSSRRPMVEVGLSRHAGHAYGFDTPTTVEASFDHARDIIQNHAIRQLAVGIGGHHLTSRESFVDHPELASRAHVVAAIEAAAKLERETGVIVNVADLRDPQQRHDFLAKRFDSAQSQVGGTKPGHATLTLGCYTSGLDLGTAPGISGDGIPVDIEYQLPTATKAGSRTARVGTGAATSLLGDRPARSDIPTVVFSRMTQSPGVLESSRTISRNLHAVLPDGRKIQIGNASADFDTKSSFWI